MNILSDATATMDQVKLWAEDKNASELAISLIPKFWEVALSYGVNPVVVFCQAMKETGFMRFGGVINAEFFNTCGLKNSRGGDCNDPEAHQRFSSWEEGIKAHCEHLSLYAGKEIENPIDPRHFTYLLGKCITVEELSGNWAGLGYGEAIVGMCREVEKY